MNDLLQKIRDFLSLQLVLLAAFTKKFPDCKDYKFLLDFLRNGNLLVEGGTGSSSNMVLGCCLYIKLMENELMQGGPLARPKLLI